MKITCGKCNGKGFISAYVLINHGICYSCKGTGSHLTSKKNIEANKKRIAERHKKQEITAKNNTEKMEKLVKKYYGDERIKPDTYNYPMRLWEVVNLIDKFERGEIKVWRKHWG